MFSSRDCYRARNVCCRNTDTHTREKGECTRAIKKEKSTPRTEIKRAARIPLFFLCSTSPFRAVTRTIVTVWIKERNEFLSSIHAVISSRWREIKKETSAHWTTAPRGASSCLRESLTVLLIDGGYSIQNFGPSRFQYTKMYGGKLNYLANFSLNYV